MARRKRRRNRGASDLENEARDVVADLKRLEGHVRALERDVDKLLVFDDIPDAFTKVLEGASALMEEAGETVEEVRTMLEEEIEQLPEPADDEED